MASPEAVLRLKQDFLIDSRSPWVDIHSILKVFSAKSKTERDRANGYFSGPIIYLPTVPKRYKDLKDTQETVLFQYNHSKLKSNMFVRG